MSSDPSDWPVAKGGLLCRELDRSLRCPICSDFFDTPLSLLCNHAFCASCIRSNIQYQERSGEAKCPCCRAKCEGGDLKVVPLLGVAAAAYCAARPVILTSIKKFVQPPEATDTAPQQAARLSATAVQHAEKSSLQSKYETMQRRDTTAHRKSIQRPNTFIPTNGACDGIVLSSDSDAGGGGEPSATRIRHLRAYSIRQTRSSSRPDTRLHANLRNEQKPVAAMLAVNRHCGNPSSAPQDHGGSSVHDGDDDDDDDTDSSRSSTLQSEDRNDDADDPDFKMDSNRQSPSRSPAQQLPPLLSSTVRRLSAKSERNVRELPPGQIRCPNCGTMLPEKFINSHLDSCLAKSAMATGKANGNNIGSADSRHLPGNAEDHCSRDGTEALSSIIPGRRKRKSTEPLKVPPKLAFSLLGDKQMRDTCKKYKLPATGKKEVMAERYTKLRLEVQTLNDAGQLGYTYADVARRVAQAESRAATAALAPLSRRTIAAVPSITGQAEGFQDLIKATRQRCVAEKAARTAAKHQSATSSPNEPDVAAAGKSGKENREESVNTAVRAEFGWNINGQIHSGPNVTSAEQYPARHTQVAQLPDVSRCCSQSSTGAAEDYVACSQLQQAIERHTTAEQNKCFSMPSSI